MTTHTSDGKRFSLQDLDDTLESALDELTLAERMAEDLDPAGLEAVTRKLTVAASILRQAQRTLERASEAS